MDVLGNSFSNSLERAGNGFSCGVDLMWFVVLWTCVELPLFSFFVLCALYLYLVFKGHWSLLELWFSMSLGIGIHELGSELKGFGIGLLEVVLQSLLDMPRAQLPRYG